MWSGTFKKFYGHEDVTEATARRYLMSIPEAVRLVCSEGAWTFDKVQPSVIRDYTEYKPMDFILSFKDKVCRAEVVNFMDMRTRAIVG